MSFGAGKVQIDFVADDSQFAQRAANVKRILANMGQQAGVSATTIKRALFAAGGQFQYFAMHLASGGSAVSAFGAGVLSLGYIFQGLVIPVAAAVVALNLLKRTLEATKQRQKELAEETEKWRRSQIAHREAREKLPGVGEAGAVEAREKSIKDAEEELRRLREGYYGRKGTSTQKELVGSIALQEKEVARLEGLTQSNWAGVFNYRQNLKEAREELERMPKAYEEQRDRLEDIISSLKNEQIAVEGVAKIQAYALADLEEKKRVLQELLGVEEERGAALKERAPVRATAQFVGAAELWKQTQASVAGSGAREQLQAIKDNLTETKRIRAAVENTDKNIANLKETSGSTTLRWPA